MKKNNKFTIDANQLKLSEKEYDIENIEPEDIRYIVGIPLTDNFIVVDVTSDKIKTQDIKFIPERTEDVWYQYCIIFINLLKYTPFKDINEADKSTTWNVKFKDAVLEFWLEPIEPNNGVEYSVKTKVLKDFKNNNIDPIAP